MIFFFTLILAHPRSVSFHLQYIQYTGERRRWKKQKWKRTIYIHWHFSELVCGTLLRLTQHTKKNKNYVMAHRWIVNMTPLKKRKQKKLPYIRVCFLLLFCCLLNLMVERDGIFLTHFYFYFWREAKICCLLRHLSELSLQGIFHFITLSFGQFELTLHHSVIVVSLENVEKYFAKAFVICAFGRDIQSSRNLTLSLRLMDFRRLKIHKHFNRLY
jgi:hypothetical protein